MGDKFLNKSGQEHVEKLFVDESCITKKCFLKLTEDRSDYVQDIPAHVLGTIKYPKANLYYALTEDTHPKKRIDTVSKFFEEQKVVSHSASFKERFTNQEEGFTNHSNLEKEAVNHYLRTEPPSFVIFGKPGLLHGNLASAIANSWNCVLISPELVIRQEIDAGTEKGQYIENILRSGKSVEYNKIIMDLMRCRIGKRDVKHRGYVVEFSPLIPDMNFDDSSYSSTSVNMNTCPEFCENTVSENSEAHEDLITSNDVGCKTQYEYEQEIARQIDVMFTVWPRKPLIIIYLVCPKQDLASRCARWRRDRTSQEYNIFDENDYTHLYDGKESDSSYDFSQVANEQSIMNILTMSSVFFDKLHCDVYERYALPVIDKWVLAHDPQHVIRVDGCSSTRRVLQILETRLCALALQPSILPKKMIVQDDVDFLETSAEINLNDELAEKSAEINLNDELAEKSAEEIFEILKQREVVSPKYLWKLSAWKFYCPVALAQGRTIKGHSKHAIRFLSKIFFLSSQEAMNLFIENPRTFLLPPNPRPTCKIAVFGPKYAGKSELSIRLAETFGGIVINVDEIMKKLIKQREESLNKKLSENDLNVQITLDSIDISVDEKANIIIQNIKEIPEMELEDELRRDGGYVVDGMCVDDQVWRKIVDANIIFEDIIVLFENEPYAYLLNKFRNFFYLDNSEHKVDYEAEDTEEDQEEYRMSHEEWEYLEHLTRFESEWIKFEEQILKFGGNVIRCNLTDIENVTEYVINHIKNRFDTSVSAQEKDQENEIQQEEATAAEIETSLATENDKRENEYLAYSIDLKTAEQLLNCGYFFFSAFGRWCPVQVYANKIPIQMFLPMKDRGQIFPVVHHPYIYFLAGKAALIAFLNDFSRYLTIDCRPSLIPLRISIIGPPQCGKTTLANRFAKTYGMKIINNEKALRHMLKYYSWTESARKAEHDELRTGQPASIESVMRAIEIFSIGPRAATQGYILDGYPLSREQAEQYVLLGMQPMIVLDLKADLEFCIECYRGHGSATRPNYPVNFLEEWYAEWQEDQAIFQDWLKKFSQNVIELDAAKNKWHVWTRADDAVRSRFADIMLYFNEADLEKVHSLKYMCVSPYEFRQRQSQYTSYCPVCWFLEKNLRTSGQSVDSQGMIQFREYFYWICPQHMNTFVKDPLQYVSPVKAISLPDDRPRILKQIVDTEHACWVQRLQVSGLCLVTYIDNLPDRKLTEGRADLGVIFKARRVPVPDTRFDYLCEYFKPASKVPAFLHVMDIAGLVKGAAEGQGLGNNFLSHIGACDGIFHLCRVFEDDDVTHIEGDVNPVRDLDIISEELRLKDVEFLNTHLEKLEKLVIRGNDKKLKPEYETLLKVKGVLVDEKKHIRFADWSSNDVEVLNKYLFLTSKPILYLVNMSEKDYLRKKNKWLMDIKLWVDKNDPGAVLIPFSTAFENKILDMDEAEREAYLKKHQVTSALDKIIVQGYKALNLQYFFTAGHDEVKAWTIQKGTKAPQAAGKIHTDFEKGFIMAEVMKFEDFKNEGSEAAVKAAGKYRQQGRAYVVEDGDIIFFKFNAGAGLKDAKKK